MTYEKQVAIDRAAKSLSEKLEARQKASWELCAAQALFCQASDAVQSAEQVFHATCVELVTPPATSS